MAQEVAGGVSGISNIDAAWGWRQSRLRPSDRDFAARIASARTPICELMIESSPSRSRRVCDVRRVDEAPRGTVSERPNGSAVIRRPRYFSFCARSPDVEPSILPVSGAEQLKNSLAKTTRHISRRTAHIRGGEAGPSNSNVSSTWMRAAARGHERFPRPRPRLGFDPRRSGDFPRSRLSCSCTSAQRGKMRAMNPPASANRTSVGRSNHLRILPFRSRNLGPIRWPASAWVRKSSFRRLATFRRSTRWRRVARAARREREPRHRSATRSEFTHPIAQRANERIASAIRARDCRPRRCRPRPVSRSRKAARTG